MSSSRWADVIETTTLLERASQEGANTHWQSRLKSRSPTIQSPITEKPNTPSTTRSPLRTTSPLPSFTLSNFPFLPLPIHHFLLTQSNLPTSHPTLLVFPHHTPQLPIHNFCIVHHLFNITNPLLQPLCNPILPKVPFLSRRSQRIGIPCAFVTLSLFRPIRSSTSFEKGLE